MTKLKETETEKYINQMKPTKANKTFVASGLMTNAE